MSIDRDQEDKNPDLKVGVSVLYIHELGGPSQGFPSGPSMDLHGRSLYGPLREVPLWTSVGGPSMDLCAKTILGPPCRVTC